MTAIHQFVPSFTARDAVGTHTVKVREVLRSMGIDSEIYAVERGRGTPVRARPYRTFSMRRQAPDTWLLYQFSAGNLLTRWLLERPEPKIVNFHNITPPSFFTGWHGPMAMEQEAGLRQLTRLAGAAKLGIADSRFNEQEMIAAGFTDTAVVPLLFDLPSPRPVVAAVAPATAASTWLFVGRLVPNKAQHDLVRALAVYRRVYDRDAELVLVGKPAVPAYAEAVRNLATELGLTGAVRYLGSVDDDELRAAYRDAAVYVCLSEHEGFCAPVLEAMAHDLPVVAYAAAAVPETVGAAGLLLPEKSPATVAAAVHRVVADRELRDQLVRRGRARAAEFGSEISARHLRGAVERLVAT